MTINRSKGLLGTSETIHSGSASAAPRKAYLLFEVKDIESTKTSRKSNYSHHFKGDPISLEIVNAF